MRGCRRLGGVGAHCVKRHVRDMAMWGRTVWKDKSETWRCAKHIVRSSSESWGALCDRL